MINMRKVALICFIWSSCFHHSFAEITWNDITKNVKYKTYHLSETLKPIISTNYPYTNVSEQCTKSLIRYVNDLKNWETWAVHMFDVTGKPTSSFLKGTFTDFGSFDDCIEIRVDENEASHAFRGQFCMLHMQSPLISPVNYRMDNGTAYFEKYGHPPDWMSGTMKFDGLLRKFGLYLGICIPSTCSEEDILNIVKAYTNSADLKVSLSDCQIDEPKKWPISAKLSLLIILGIVALCPIGTYLDTYKKSIDNNLEKEYQSLGMKVLKAFSVSKNWDTLTKLNEKEHSLDYLTGMKFWLSMWIVFGHSFIFETYWTERYYTNYLNCVEMLTPISIIVENCTCVVEYHFCISGFLLSYTLWKKLEKNNGNINVKEIIIQKIVRLAPVHIFLIVLTFILPMIWNGPIWNSTWDEELRKCYNYGWSNLFFFQNFQHYTNICWTHTWYIAASLQIQIVSILLLLLIYRHPKTGLFCGFLINIGCYWHDFYTSYSNNYLLPSLKSFQDFRDIRNYVSDIYFKPYSHVASHTIGMILGWLVLKGYTIPKKYHTSIWVVYFPSSLLLLFAVYHPTQNITLIALHNTFRNTIQSVLFAWLLYACTTRSAGFIGKFFSFRFYAPMDRIGYDIYLLHPIIYVYFDAILRERNYMWKIHHFVAGLTCILVSCVLATIGYLLVDEPFNKIYNLLVKRKSTITTKKSHDLIQNGIKNE